MMSFIWSYQNSVLCTIESHSHQIFWFTLHTWFTTFRFMFTPRLCGFTPEINLFTPKLNNFYCTVKVSHWTRSVLTLNWPHDVATWRRRRTQMALTVMRKREGIPMVGDKLFFSLDASCRLEKHDTCATNTTLFLLHPPHPPVPPHGDPLWPPCVKICKLREFDRGPCGPAAASAAPECTEHLDRIVDRDSGPVLVDIRY
jgi:hypothetical protein